jgi:hypothetical protein
MSAASILKTLQGYLGTAWEVRGNDFLNYLATQLTKLADVTAGTVSAGSAAVVDANKDVSGFRNVGLTGTLTFGAGGQIDVDSGTTTAVGTGGTSTATLSKMAGVVTTDAITTAAGASHVMTITNTLVAIGDLIMVSKNGGSNTGGTPIFSAVAGAGTITVTIANKHASAAFAGTEIFSFLVLKA